MVQLAAEAVTPKLVNQPEVVSVCVDIRRHDIALNQNSTEALFNGDLFAGAHFVRGSHQ